MKLRDWLGCDFIQRTGLGAWLDYWSFKTFKLHDQNCHRPMGTEVEKFILASSPSGPDVLTRY